MRVAASMLAGLILGALLTFSTVAISGDWYEHHIYVAGDPNPVDMVNAQGWELTSHDGSIWQFRRPRFRLH